ncbi:MAG TPA: 4-hydroxybenzoate octaprenyltransferase, partial [Synechococcales bacterium UBA8647]|nr:4-hydroxybenzoate octaprenyltransferase [Synechococcales bacterium UBA8647]
WTFGFDTVYAMADRRDDARIGVRSSALSLGDHALQVVGWCYLLAWLLLSSAAAFAGVGVVYWLAALGALWAGWRDLRELRHQEREGQPKIGQHFQRQVWLATLLWAGLVVGRGMG